MSQAVAGEALTRPWIGIRFQPIDRQLSTEQNLPVDDGASSATPRRPTARPCRRSCRTAPPTKAGLKDGDIITTINGIADRRGASRSTRSLIQFAPGRHRHPRRPARRRRPRPSIVTLGTRPRRPVGRRRRRRSRPPHRRPRAVRAAAAPGARSRRRLAVQPRMPAAPDLHARPGQRAAEVDPRLADPDGDLVDREVRQDLVRDRLGERLDEVEAGRLDDAGGQLVHGGVVDGLLQVVVDAGRLEVELQLHVDLERLAVACSCS